MRKLFKQDTYFLSPVSLRIWLFCCGLFMMHQILQYGFKMAVRWMDNWLDPFLFPMIILPLLRWERRRITRKYSYSFSLLESIATTAAMIIISEILLPLLSTRFVADPTDALCILTGGIGIHFVMTYTGKPRFS